MPSALDINKLFREFSNYQNNHNIYNDLENRVKDYLNIEPNFEEMLNVILSLHNWKNEKNIFALKALIPSPNNIDYNSDELFELARNLQSCLLEHFRERCINVKEESIEFKAFKKFINSLCKDFTVNFVTLNYDNLILRAQPNLFTGFNKSGEFNYSSLIQNLGKGHAIYHVHGSVHFMTNRIPMQEKDRPQRVSWVQDLNQNDFGITLEERTTEGYTDHLRSQLIAGYNKAHQIQLSPFREYYSNLDSLVYYSDCILFIGYGFRDKHINSIFSHVSENKRRNVVVIDYKNHKEAQKFYDGAISTKNFFNDYYRHCNDKWGRQLSKTIPDREAGIENSDEKQRFVRFDCPYEPLAIWYDGAIKAYNNYDFIKEKLMF